MGGYPPVGVSYGLDTHRGWGDTRRTEYHTDWITAAIGGITAGRSTLWIGAPPLMGEYPMGEFPTGRISAVNGWIPAGRSIIRNGYPPRSGGIPAGRSILRNGYPPPMGGYQPGKVSF